MSGGHFNYDQFKISEIADEIERVIRNEAVNEERCYSKETIGEFLNGISLLRIAHIYAHRIDWLLSGDDGEDTFHERLNKELDQLEEECF